jgi:hypothetical protein
VAIAEALNSNYGHEEALKFVMRQHQSPELAACIAQLLKATKDNNSALYALKKLAMRTTEEGARAAWMVSQIYLEREDHAAAKEAILAHGRLAKEPLGMETLARIALMEGDLSAADHLYQQIEDNSAEAKSFLARKAYNEGDWQRARILTEELLQLHPENEMLMENWHKIVREEKQQG